MPPELIEKVVQKLQLAHKEAATQLCCGKDPPYHTVVYAPCLLQLSIGWSLFSGLSVHDQPRYTRNNCDISNQTEVNQE